MKSHIINSKKLQQELEKTQRLEEAISYKLKAVNKVKFSFSQELVTRIKELLDKGIELQNFFAESDNRYPERKYLSAAYDFRHCVV
jgi:hypothetical protein